MSVKVLGISGSPIHECQMSAFKSPLIDSGTRASGYRYPRVEDPQEVWQEAIRIGRLMGERL